MGNLTVHLQDRFIDCCPPGWVAHREVRLLPPEFEQWVGYQARADILLEQPEQRRRLWIEFEVSRADPVANHAKFATTHLFFPQRMGDVFVSMVSAHVVRGRVNLAANTIVLMRQVGMSAFQTTLLPTYSGEAIKQLNHLDLAQLKSNSDYLNFPGCLYLNTSVCSGFLKHCAVPPPGQVVFCFVLP